MKIKITVKEFNKLNFNNYEGYYWYSNSNEPVFEFKELEENKIPFVVEGFLYNKNENISISIKNLNGKYIIHKFKVENIENKIRFINEHNYPSNIDKNELLFRKMQQKVEQDGFFVWETVVDKIFVGFKKI